MNRFFTITLASLMTLSDFVPMLAMIAGTIALAAGDAQALPADRMAGRQGARASRQTGRQVSRVRRRACYALPAGAVAFAYGGLRYYRFGPRFYYPYMYQGRTVYIDIDIVNGHPVPPPPAGSIDIDIYIN